MSGGNIILYFIFFFASFFLGVLGVFFGQMVDIRSEEPITHTLIEVRNNDTIYVLER